MKIYSKNRQTETEALIKALRFWERNHRGNMPMRALFKEAADAIEELQAALEIERMHNG